MKSVKNKIWDDIEDSFLYWKMLENIYGHKSYIILEEIKDKVEDYIIFTNNVEDKLTEDIR